MVFSFDLYLSLDPCQFVNFKFKEKTHLLLLKLELALRMILFIHFNIKTIFYLFGKF